MGSHVSLVLIFRAGLDREGLAALLRTNPRMRVVGEGTCGKEAAKLCASRRPDVAIVDASCLWPTGSCRVADLLDSSPRTRVLAVAPHDPAWCAMLNPRGDRLSEPESGDRVTGCLHLAVRQGVHGVLRRNSGSRELFRAIRTLADGRYWVGPEVSLRDPREPRVSDRERAVAWLVGQGRCNKEIARMLGASELTVKKHVSHLLRKLSLQDRLQLGLFVVRHPLLFVEPDGPREVR